jgi:phosphoribosyl-ATP pyrophosphohydrolase/phosphoribosyl-AMP cyclohydrolase
MIVPSIDLMGGRTVQLIGGREHAIDAGDPIPWLTRFARVGEVAVIDLDAALRRGPRETANGATNEALVADLCTRADVRVGGGIRDERTAKRWLDRGATRIVIGTAAEPALLAKLPRERVIVALDAEDGEVVVEGWRTRTGRGVAERMHELRDFAGGFLVTFVEREGRLGGTALERVQGLVEAAGDARVTIAGGVTTPQEVAALDRLGADAQVGMALYTGRMELADAFLAPASSDRADGLLPTIVTDEGGRALGLVYSSRESVRASLERGRGVYQSRKRGLWEKGATSGAGQELVKIELDCDRDALRFVVRQAEPGFCHKGTRTCFDDGAGVEALVRRVARAARGDDPDSYTARLVRDPALLAAKLREEAGELAEARDVDAVRAEAADVLYFAAVALARAGVSLAGVERELERRARRVSRRAGDAKEVRK